MGGIRPGQARGPWVGTSSGGGGGTGTANLTFMIYPSQMVPHTEGGSGLLVTITQPANNVHYESARFSPATVIDDPAMSNSGRFDTPISLYPGVTLPSQARIKIYFTQIDDLVGSGFTVDMRFWVESINPGEYLGTTQSLHFVACLTPTVWALGTQVSNWFDIDAATPITENSLIVFRLRRLEQFDTFTGLDFHVLKVRLELR